MPFLIGAIRHQPALELRQFKDCLGDEQRHYYRRLENCSNTQLEKLKERKSNQEHYYNRGTRELVDQQSVGTFCVRPLPADREKLLKKATPIKQVAPRSYEINLQGNVNRRNRRHLVKTSESSPPKAKFEPDVSLPTEEMQPSTSEEAPNSSEPLEQAQGSLPVPSESLKATPVTCTRSGRTVRLPKRFRDYV